MSDAPAAPAAEPSASPASAAPAAAPASPPAFLGSGSPAATPQQPSAPDPSGPPASPPADPTSSPRFFGDHIQKDGTFVEGWTESLQKAGYERLANKAALVKDEASLFRSIDEALGLLGKKTAGISYPKEGASPEQIAEFRREAGVPETIDGYEIKPAQLPEGVEWRDETATAVAELLHRHHVPKAAAQELVNLHLADVSQQAAQAQEAHSKTLETLSQQAAQKFQQEWGADYDVRLEANRAFVTSRFTPEDLANPALQTALSHPAVVTLVDEARRALREAPLPGVGSEGGGSGGTHSPRQQAVEIMKANPGWKSNPELAKRVTDLYSLDAAQQKRRSR